MRSSPLELGEHGRRRLDDEVEVVALAIPLHAVGEVPKAPILALGDPAALLGDLLTERLCQGLRLLTGEIGSRDERVFIERHATIISTLPTRDAKKVAATEDGPLRYPLATGRSPSGGTGRKLAPENTPSAARRNPA